VKSAAGASNWSPVILLVIFAMMQFLCVIVTPRRRAAQGSLRDLLAEFVGRFFRCFD
jgi:hypothetical protein